MLNKEDLMKKYQEVVFEIDKLKTKIAEVRYDIDYFANDRLGPFGIGNGYASFYDDLKAYQKELASLKEEKQKLERLLYSMGMNQEELDNYTESDGKNKKF